MPFILALLGILFLSILGACTGSSVKIVDLTFPFDDQTIDYRVTVEDPTMFSQPWTVSAPMTTDQASRGVARGPVLEYACHEGNYAMPNVLGGARAVESGGSR